jgi:nucleotide-binding universal stress UspA family protein
VLCALNLDGSGEQSWPLASLIAHRFGASLDALHAPSPLLSFGNRADRVRRLIAEHNARERLEGLVAPLGSSLSVSTYVTRGQASSVILSHSERRASDLIVLDASSEASATVTPVSTGASCAVLSVPSGAGGRAMRRILLPIGALVADVPATAWAISLASRFGAEVSVLRVGSSKPGFWKVLTSRRCLEAPPLEEQHAAVVRAGATTLRLKRAGVQAPGVERLEPADYEAIADHGESGGFDLIVMGMHTQGDAATDGQGIVADLRRRATIPVLSVRDLGQAASFATIDHEAARSRGGDAHFALSA